MDRMLVCGTEDKSSILFTRLPSYKCYLTLIYKKLTCSLIGKAVRFECMYLCSTRSRSGFINSNLLQC